MKRKTVAIGICAVTALLLIAFWPRARFRFLTTYNAKMLDTSSDFLEVYVLDGSFQKVCQAIRDELPTWNETKRGPQAGDMKFADFLHPDGSIISVVEGPTENATDVEMSLEPSWLDKQWEWLRTKLGGSPKT